MIYMVGDRGFEPVTSTMCRRRRNCEQYLTGLSVHKLFENGHIVLNKHSKTPGGNIGIFFAN